MNAVSYSNSFYANTQVSSYRNDTHNISSKDQNSSTEQINTPKSAEASNSSLLVTSKAVTSALESSGVNNNENHDNKVYLTGEEILASMPKKKDTNTQNNNVSETEENNTQNIYQNNEEYQAVEKKQIDNNENNSEKKDNTLTNEKNDKDKSKDTKLSEEELKQLDKLKKRDREVKAHEQAHMAAGGAYVKGGPSYEYQTGPDGGKYAVGGHVNIDTSTEKTPEATINKAQSIIRAALAPAEPSGQDRAVASKARQMLNDARKEIQAKQQEDAKSSKPEIKNSDNNSKYINSDINTNNSAIDSDKSLKDNSMNTDNNSKANTGNTDLKEDNNISKINSSYQNNAYQKTLQSSFSMSLTA